MTWQNDSSTPSFSALPYIHPHHNCGFNEPEDWASMFSNRRDIPLPIDLGSVPDCFIVVDTTPSEPRRSRLLFRQ